MRRSGSIRKRADKQSQRSGRADRPGGARRRRSASRIAIARRSIARRTRRRHQGVIAWLGAFAYVELETLVTDRRARAARRARRRRGSAQPRRDPALGVPARRRRRDHPRASRGAGHRGRREGVGRRERARADRAGRQPRARARAAARARRVARRRARDAESAQPIDKLDGKMPLVPRARLRGRRRAPARREATATSTRSSRWQRTAIGSFNVSVAAAIALYESAASALARLRSSRGSSP